MERFLRFVAAAGKKGVSLMTGGVLCFAIALYEHFRGSSLAGFAFAVGSILALLAGAFYAWDDADRKYDAERNRNSKPDITGEVPYAACHTILTSNEPGRSGRMILLKLRITNRTTVDTTIKSAELDLQKDGKRYSGERQHIRIGYFVTYRDDRGNHQEQVVDLLQRVTYEHPVR